MEPELKPCPFCRGEAKIKRVTGSINYRYVKCSSCGARTKDWFGVDVAVKTWNTRVYPEEVQKTIERDKPKMPVRLKGASNIVCPTCGAYLKQFYEPEEANVQFCYNCGQRLNWEDEQ